MKRIVRDGMGQDQQPVGPLAAVVGAVRAAAGRRGLDQDPAWQGLDAVLGEWARSGPAPSDTAPMAPSGTAPTRVPEAAVIDESLERIAAVFRLDESAANLLLVAAAPDLDPNIAAAYGLLLGAGGPRPASVALALELAGIAIVSAAGRAALGPVSQLRRWALLSLQDGPWLLGRSLTAGEDVVGALLGAPVAEPISWAMVLSDDESEIPADAGGVGELAEALTAGHSFCWVEDPPGAGGASAARAAFALADIRCAGFDLDRRPAGVSMIDAVRAVVRRAGLSACGVILTSCQTLTGSAEAPAVAHLLAQAPVPVVMVGACRWNADWHTALPLTVRAAPLRPEQRIALWRRQIPAFEVSDAALAAYRLTPEQIASAGRHVLAQAQATRRPADPLLVAETVRMLGGSGGLRAGLGWARTTFDDLQVPDETRRELERLAGWVRLRDSVTAGGAVHGIGGKGTGVAALFTGSPGTGKTLAAHVIADTAGLELMQVDLSGVIDKYIGETEKNLEKIFVDAENLNVVLFFDEADALFGKRSEVRDAHDRFANQEVSYLLQRMEQFDGITVLATNLRGNLDTAFARRLHFIVHFPDPDEPTRARLWTRLLAMAGPQDPADPVDVGLLAASMELSGGDVRNIVLSAVYDAAIGGAALGMQHVVDAAVREYAKLGRRTPPGLG